MKNEYLEKLELAKKYLSWDESLDDETFEKQADDGFDIMKELLAQKDTEILSGLLELFNKRTEWYGGVCETLDNDIWDNYEPSQILDALKQNKFKYLLDNDLLRACTMAIAIINTGYGEALKEIFNTQRSENSAKFVEDLYGWGKYGNYEEYASILREDMKKW